MDDDGHIIGIMTEPRVGRPLEAHDWDLVERSLRKLYKIGYILDCPDFGSMLVTDKGELRFTQMHNVIELPKDPKARREKVENRSKHLRNLFSRLRQGCPCPDMMGAMTRGRVSVAVKILVPQSDPERLLRGITGWDVEMVRDRWAIDQRRHLKLVRSGGVKRLLEKDSSDEEGGADHSELKHRRTKKLRGLAQYPGPKAIVKYEAPLPRLPVAWGDLPLMPPSMFGGSSSRTSSATPPAETGIPSWLLEGQWLALAKTSYSS